jgi:hypothetical protein
VRQDLQTIKLTKEHAMSSTDTSNISSAANLSSDQEKLRIVVGAGLVIASMFLIYFALQAAINFVGGLQQKNAGDVVAIIGSITTFIGTTVGLFFGINVGQSGKSQAADTAMAASQTARIATAMAEQAKSTADQANALRANAQASLSFVTAQRNAVSARYKRLKGRQQTKADLVQTSRPADFAQQSGGALNPNEVSQTLYEITTNWLAALTGTPADDIDPSKTFAAAPPDGFGLSSGQYLAFCNDCETQTDEALPVTLTLTGQFRSAHANSTLSSFVNDVTALLAPGGGQ